MDKISIEVRIDQRIDTDVDVSDVIQSINEAPMKRRWNYISQMLNGVHLELSDVTDEQKEIIKKYLKNKLSLFVSSEEEDAKVLDIRQAFADYVKSEGCSCCQDIDAHKDAAKKLGKLLNAKQYDDGSGYNFYAYASEK